MGGFCVNKIPQASQKRSAYLEGPAAAPSPWESIHYSIVGMLYEIVMARNSVDGFCIRRHENNFPHQEMMIVEHEYIVQELEK